jgi:hypothetical protein
VHRPKVRTNAQCRAQTGISNDLRRTRAQQQFLVDRQGLQVFWPSSGLWYGAWGTPSSTPPGFQPKQSTYTTAGWATISQINANTNAPTACPSGCDTMLPQAGPPSQ